MKLFAVAVTGTLAAILAAGASAYGQPGVPRASHAFTVVADDVPRFVFGDSETLVSVSVRNDGLTTWDPEQQFHVSYRWLPSSGDEGRPSPPDPGGLRTDLPHSVGPGESITILARIAAPDGIGWFKLQWDMVQEGVTWFSERDPVPQPATRVAVLPSVAALSSLVPVTIVVLLLLLRRRRPEREEWLRAGTVLWGISSLFVKQWMLVSEARGMPPAEAVWITAVFAAAPVLTAALITRRRAVLWCLVGAGSVLLLADALYFRFFGDLLSASVVLESPEAGRAFASAVSLLEAGDILFFLDLVLAVPLLRRQAAAAAAAAARQPRRPALTRRLAAGGAAAATAGAILYWSVSRPPAALALSQVFSNMEVAHTLGAFGYHALDLWTEARSHWFRPPLSAAEFAEVRDWFDRRAPLRAGSGRFLGAARGRNLLVIQAESLQGFVLGLEIDGQEITPNLNRWRSEGLTFSAVTDQTNEGRTSDAELTALASLLPLEHGAAAFHYPQNHFVTLPGVLGAHGYSTLSAVPFNSAFWNRRVTHPAYGFSRSLFDDAFGPGESIGWGLNDRDFLHQAVPMLTGLPRPFLAWLITLSLHHPYAEFPGTHKALSLSHWEGEPFGNYLHAMRFLDTALGQLRADLAGAGLGDDTVIVVIGDHDAGFAWSDPLARTVGIAPSVINWFLADRVPWIVLAPGPGAPRGEVMTRAGQIDIAPTLLALLGIDPGPLPMMGRNLLGNLVSVPHIRPHGSWVDDRWFFDGEAGAGRRCYDIAARANVPQDACEAGIAEADLARKIGRLVLAYDLQASLLRAEK